MRKKPSLAGLFFLLFIIAGCFADREESSLTETDGSSSHEIQDDEEPGSSGKKGPGHKEETDSSDRATPSGSGDSDESESESRNETNNPPEAEEKRESERYPGGKREVGTYVDEEYQFSMNYPIEVEPFMEISYGTWEPEAERVIDFYYSSQDENIHQTIFSVVIFNYAREEYEWEHPMFRYITTHNGKTYALAVAGDPGQELLEPENSGHLRNVQRLMADIDLIIETLEFK